jgi:glycosyltransferase involved in cell wall biosynthesis
VTQRKGRPIISVVISTYNRVEVLPRALTSATSQDLDPEQYEVIVVDNNSTDGTREVVESLRRGGLPLTYVFEPRQGVSYGRNTGIELASGPIVAFTDDDVRVSRDWLSTIVSVLAEHPEVACVGGKILPQWPGPVPSWLTREHWAPLALVDYGDEPVYVDANRRLCLLTANAAYRRDVLFHLGMFSPDVQTLGRAAACEDHELLLRLWRAGGRGLYWPALMTMSDVAPERLHRRYHRQWHQRHGRFSAIMRDEAMEQTRYGRVLGAPAHIYRQAAGALAGWVGRAARLDSAGAFSHEMHLRTCIGFLVSRWGEFLSGRYRAPRTAG